jgi:hypothetical protein
MALPSGRGTDEEDMVDNIRLDLKKNCKLSQYEQNASFPVGRKKKGGYMQSFTVRVANCGYP